MVGMNAEWKQKWLKALRGGQYKQAKYGLRYRKDGEDQYCCLGVLCDLIDPSLWEKTDPDSDDQNCAYCHNREPAFPSAKVVSQSELFYETYSHLVGLNDSFGKTFDEIANYIEENL